MSFISAQRVFIATEFNNSQTCNPFRSSDYTDSESEDEDEVLDDLATLKLEANAKSYQIFQALSPTQKEEAKKRFPDFWRTYQAVQ